MSLPTRSPVRRLVLICLAAVVTVALSGCEAHDGLAVHSPVSSSTEAASPTSAQMSVTPRTATSPLTVATTTTTTAGETLEQLCGQGMTHLLLAVPATANLPAGVVDAIETSWHSLGFYKMGCARELRRYGPQAVVIFETNTDDATIRNVLYVHDVDLPGAEPVAVSGASADELLHGLSTREITDVEPQQPTASGVYQVFDSGPRCRILFRARGLTPVIVADFAETTVLLTVAATVDGVIGDYIEHGSLSATVLFYIPASRTTRAFDITLSGRSASMIENRNDAEVGSAVTSKGATPCPSNAVTEYDIHAAEAHQQVAP